MSNFAENLENSPQRAILKSAGFFDEDIKKPLIGILSACNPIMPGHSGLKLLEEAVAEGVRSRGGTPVVLPLFSVCDGLANGHHGAKFCLPSRDLTADCVEAVVCAHALDGAVLLGSCDHTVAGMILGSIRVNIPAVVVGSGPARAGGTCGRRAGFSDVMKGVGGVRSGKISKSELEALEENACSCSGTCEGLSDSVNAVVEALGLSLPGNSTEPAGSIGRRKLARRTGETVMYAVENQLTPKKLLTLAAVKNAIALNMALLPSTNAHLHILAAAQTLGIRFDKFLKPETLAQIGAKTPLLADLRPSGEHFIEDLHCAGGTGAVIRELTEAGLMDGSCLTVTGRTIRESYSACEVRNPAVIRPVSQPVDKLGGIAFLQGNLADSALVKRSGVKPEMYTFSGPARVFDSIEDAAIAVDSGRIRPGDCLVVRFEGPKGGPGMREITQVLSAVHGYGLENRIAVLTDGRLPSFSAGLNVCQVSPEAYGGPLALLRDDDVVEIDLKKGKLAVKLNNRELEQRRKKLHVEEKSLSGLLKRYKQEVTGADRGALVE